LWVLEAVVTPNYPGTAFFFNHLRPYPNTDAEEMRDELREIIWKKYRIVYRLEDGQINIVTVVHSRQNFDPNDI